MILLPSCHWTTMYMSYMNSILHVQHPGSLLSYRLSWESLCCVLQYWRAGLSSCLSPLFSPMRRKQGPEALAVFEGKGRTTSEWEIMCQATSRWKEKEHVIGRQIKERTGKNCGSQSLLPKLMMFICMFLYVVSYRGTQLLIGTNSNYHLNWIFI